MSFVCLWSPSWPTGADFPADLVPALLAHTPRVLVAAHACLWADARGFDAGTLAQELLDTVHLRGWHDVHAGAASTAIAAELAATRCEAELLIVRPGTDRAFLAPLPVAVLQPSTLLASLLDGIGVESCADLAALDAEGVEVRLGAEGVKAWKLARALDPRPVFVTPPRQLPNASLEWVEYALRNPERLLFVINALAGTVCSTLASQGERAREMSLVFTLANRSSLAHPLRASRPTASQKSWMRLIRVALERLRLPDAVTGVELRVERVTGNDGAQGDLFDRGFATAPAVETAIAQLVDDQGDVVLVPSNSAHPLVDRRTEWLTDGKQREDASASGGPATRKRRVRATAVKERAVTTHAPTESPTDPHLTLQLLTPPRPVSVATAPRRDHHVPIRYHDKRWYGIVDAAGPDRVSGAEWDAPYAREYFRCVREDGLLVWLYREGEETWYVHGWWD